MADTRLTIIGFFRAVRLCGVVLFVPARMQDLEKQDDAARKELPPEESTHRVYRVRHAFWTSMLLVVASLFTGFLLGRLSASLFDKPTQTTVILLQIIGASLLLWGTIFVRGWEIQTIGGVTLTERVNQWLYRGLYCIGTAVVVWSLAWTS